MSVHTILKMGNPILRKLSSPFSPEEIESEETKKLISDMFETMVAVGGIGLAAPQIGINKQLTIIELPTDSERYPDAPSSERFIIFNPKISFLNDELQGFWEGCLSVPGLRGFVERPKHIKVDYLDEKGNPQSIELEGFLPRFFNMSLITYLAKFILITLKTQNYLFLKVRLTF